MITGLYTALADSIPMICITGQANTDVLHREAFQAVDIVEIARPVCKWAYQVKETAQLPWAFREAFRICREGRPGPVLIDLPLNVQKGAGHRVLPRDATGRWSSPSRRRATRAIDRALELLAGAERPLIVAGGGVIVANASDELVALAETLDIPVSPTLMGKGAIPEDHPLWAGMVGIQTSQRHANQLFLESDVVLAVGARFGDRHTGDLSRLPRRPHVHPHRHRAAADRQGVPGRPRDRGRREARAGRAGAARDAPRSRPEWTARLAELRGTLTRRTDFDDSPIKPPRVYRRAQRVLRRGHGLRHRDRPLPDLERPVPAHLQAAPLPVLRPGRPAGLGGARRASGPSSPRPTKQVVGVVGDYSFQFLMEEVAVAVQYRVPFVLVMVNNGYMGLIRQAEQPYDMKTEVDLDVGRTRRASTTSGVMRAMGADGVRVTEASEIAGALEWATAEAERRGVPVLVEVMVEREANAAMGKAIDAIVEFEPVPEAAEVAA